MSEDDAQKVKKKLLNEEFYMTFDDVELPDIDSIKEIDDIFRQNLFYEWLKNSPQFKELTKKFHDLSEDEDVKNQVRIDPSKAEDIAKISDLIAKVEFNNTNSLHIVVPEMLRHALFAGWDKQGFQFMRLLFPYGKTKLFIQFIKF
jgi:hypothetical protein